jgi:membrane protein
MAISESRYNLQWNGMNYQSIETLLVRALSEWKKHEAPRLGAALAFYSILSLAPLVILTVAIVALVFGHSAAQDDLIEQAQNMLGQEGAGAVKAVLQHAQKPASGIVASVIGAITLLFGASGVAGELQSALNRIWDAKSENPGGIWGAVKQRLFSISMVLGVGFLLLVSLVISAALAALGKFYGTLLPMPQFVLDAINFVVSMAGIAVLFALIFRYVPAVSVAWKTAWVGGSVTAVLFTIGKFLIGLYLGKSAVGSPYGAAGSIIAIIVWVYYSAMIFLLGAEFTHVLDASGGQKAERAPSF